MKCIPITAKSEPDLLKTILKGEFSLLSVFSNYLNKASGFLKISLGPINPFIALWTDKIATSVLSAALAPLLSLSYLPALMALQGM